MSERGGTIQILTGEAMWPDRVNARWPGAQFVARARFDSGDAQRPLAFRSLDAPAIWGVLFRFPMIRYRRPGGNDHRSGRAHHRLLRAE